MVNWTELIKYNYSFRCIVLSILLVGCDSHDDSTLFHQQSLDSLEVSPSFAIQEQGQTLSDMALQIALPKPSHLNVKKVTEREMPFVGRYHARISCDEYFVHCDQGSVEFILNLLPDGTAHRSIVRYGRIYYDTSTSDDHNKVYRRDTWSMSEEGKEIVVHFGEGVDFYYVIDKGRNLKMDVNKIADGRNKNFFEQGYTEPTQEYILVRD